MQHGREKLGFSQEAFGLLEHYFWPGNVRELENVVERAVLLSKGKYITAEDLPANLVSASKFEKQKPYTPMSLKEELVEPEKKIIRSALEANGWNRQGTAKTLQINRTTLYKKMKRYGLEKEAARLGL